MIVGRLIMRFLLVPLGGCVALCIAVLVVVVAHWNRFAAMVAADPQSSEDFIVALFLVGSWYVMTAMISAGGDAVAGHARRADRRGVRDPLLDVPRRQRRIVGLGRSGSRWRICASPPTSTAIL